MPTSLALPSQLTLLTSLTLYPLLLRLLTPPAPSHIRFLQSREALSALHCTLITLASLYALHQHHSAWAPPSTPPHNSATIASARSAYGATLPIITTRSALANALTAWETGYLLQDTLVLVRGARLRSRESKVRLVKEINWRVLLWHHGGLSAALAILQWYIARGRERGVLVIVMLMLMNASTPVGTLHWYLVNFRPGGRRAIVGANVAYLVAYAVFRVGLVYWVLRLFGEQSGESALGAFGRLRLACRVGTATMGVTNLVWLGMGVRGFARRYLWGTPSKRMV